MSVRIISSKFYLVCSFSIRILINSFFRAELSNAALKYSKAEKEFEHEKTSYLNQIANIKDDLFSLRDHAEMEKQTLLKEIGEKEKLISNLMEKQTKIEHHIKLKESEFANVQGKLEDRIDQLQTGQDKDFEQIKFLNEELRFVVFVVSVFYHLCFSI